MVVFSFSPSHAPAQMLWLRFMVGCLAAIFQLNSSILIGIVIITILKEGSDAYLNGKKF